VEENRAVFNGILWISISIASSPGLATRRERRRTVFADLGRDFVDAEPSAVEKGQSLWIIGARRSRC
jgi:hypothetical protein